MIFFTVIIVNYNSGARLEKCLNALQASTYGEYEVIVFDNASADGSEQAALNRGAHVRLIRSEENLGFSRGNNIAATHAKGTWLAFLNPDAYAAPDWLEVLFQATQRYLDVDAFGSTQINANDPTVLDGAGDAYFIGGVPYRGHHGWPVEILPPEGETFSCCAAAAVYRRSTFTTLGGFDERFFCYVEDVDLGFRLRLKGGKAIQIRDAVVYHEGSAITGIHSDFSVYYGHRNRIWTHYLNLPLRLLVLTLPLHICINLYLLVRFCFAGKVSSYMRAMRDGYAAIPRLHAERRTRQRGRTVRVTDLIKTITFSPVKLWRKEAVIIISDGRSARVRF